MWGKYCNPADTDLVSTLRITNKKLFIKENKIVIKNTYLIGYQTWCDEYFKIDC